MHKLNTKTIGGLTAAILAGALALGGASAASAGVTGCSASGGKQEAGAVIGAVLGGVIGNQVGGRHATGETVAGAALGAAAGSAIGCEAQKGRADNSATYSRNGYKLYRNVTPAKYSRIDDAFVARSGVNLRAAPTTNSARVGRLQAGERFQAMAQVRGSDWILVGQDGVGVGYVRGDFVAPAGRRHAAY
jgi:uncharacterized protein YgiM (DUF1202 family)